MYQPNVDVEHNTFCYRQLFEFAIDGKYKKLQKIFERDGNIPVDITNNKGQTLLYVSCLYQRNKVVTLLLQFGADPNHRSADGSTPTHAAAYSCSADILKCIVEEYGGDMRLHDKQMQTPRDWALRAGKNWNKKVLRLIESWQDQVDKKMHTNRKMHRGVTKVTRSEELLKSNLKIDYCGYGTFLHSSQSHASGYFGFAAVVPLASPTHITSSGNLSLLFSIPPSFVMEEALWCHYRVMIKRSKGKSFAVSRASEDLLIAEAKACRLMRHPNLLLLMAICVASPEESCGGTTDHWLVYEYVRFGSLYHVLHDKKRNFLPEECAKIMIQIADALWFIHQRGFIHCAMSSHAVYLSHGLVAKLGNMCCVTSRGNGACIYDVASILPHFTRWVAPEVILKDAITTKTDVYGFCVVVCEIFSGSLPWYGCDNVKIEEHIRKRRNYFMLPDWLPAELIEMLQNGLKFYSRNRIVNICDLQGCMTSLLETGKFDKMVSCLDAGEIPKANVITTPCEVSHDFVPNTLYSHIMSGGNVVEKQGNQFHLPTHAGEDVPDAKPTNIAYQSIHDNGTPRQFSMCLNDKRQPKITSDFGESKLIEVTADVHNESKHEVDKEFIDKDVGDFVSSKEPFEKMLSSSHLGLNVNSLHRKRPHSCSILTQDGLARELLPAAVRHNSFPDITSDMHPPSYASALQFQNRHSKMDNKKNNNTPTPLISITGPPDKVYSPRLVPISLSDLSKHPISSGSSSKDKKNQGKYHDLSSSFATYSTSDHLSMPHSLTSNIYPSSSERHAEFSKESDTPSTSAKYSGKDTKHVQISSESTDVPDSSFIVENVPPPEYAQLVCKVNSGCVENMPGRQNNNRTRDTNRKLSPTKSDLTSQRIPEKISASGRKVSRTMSYTRDRRLISNPKRTRWSTSALVERRRVNNAEYSAEEMYDIGHGDLEFIFESFAERKSHNHLSDSTSTSPVHVNHPIKPTFYMDKASQTEFQNLSSHAHHSDIEWTNDIVDGSSKRHSGEGKGDESCQRTYRSVLTNTESNSRPSSAGRASPFFRPESPSRHPSPCNETYIKPNGSKVQPMSKVFYHRNLQGKPPAGKHAAVHDQVLTGDAPTDNIIIQPRGGSIPIVIKGVVSPKLEDAGAIGENEDTLSSSEYLYSQEFIIPAHAEEYASNNDNHDRYEDFRDIHYGSESESECSETHLEGHLSSLQLAEADVSSHSFKDTDVCTPDTNFNAQQIPSENEQFMTCIESTELPVEQGSVSGSDVNADNIAKGVVKPHESYPLQSRKPGESGESVSEVEKCEPAVEVTSPEKVLPKKVRNQEEVTGVSQTPSKWSFQKKLCLFKVVADNGNGSNLEKRVLTQNAFSKVRQTAEMFENLTPPPSPRGAVPEKVFSPPPCVTDDTTSSTPNSSNFLQEHVGQIFETSTPVSADHPGHDIRVECKHPISPRTFEEVRRDLETSSLQKCHFMDGDNRTCTHESPCAPSNTEKENKQIEEVCEASTTFYTNHNSYEELMISSPETGIRQMVQGLLNDMIHNAISTLETGLYNDDADLQQSVGRYDVESQNYDDELEVNPSTELDINSDEESDIESSNELDVNSHNDSNVNSTHEWEVNAHDGPDAISTDQSDHHKNDNVNFNAVRLSKSVPSIIREGAEKSNPPRMAQSVSDIDSLILNASGDRAAQECSSYASNFEPGSNCYSVDTSIWSL